MSNVFSRKIQRIIKRIEHFFEINLLKFEIVDIYYIANIVAIVTEIASIATKAAEAVRTASGLSHLQYRTLVAIGSSHSSLTATELASKFDTPLATVTCALGKLVEREAASRITDPGDRRASLVLATPFGVSLTRRADQALADFLLPIWSALTREQYRLLCWSAVMASSTRGIVRAEGGSIDVNLAYYEGAVISCRAAGMALSPLDLTVNDFRALATLVISRRGLRASDLGKELMLPSSEMSRLLSSLEKRGLIDKKPHSGDGRAKLRFATEDGVRLIGRCAPAVYAAMREGVINLSSREMLGFAGIALTVNDVLRESFRYR